MSALAPSLIRAPLQFRLRSGGRASRDSFVTCAKCEAPAYIRHSERITATVKDLYCACSNTGCAHTFKTQLSFVHSISPGTIERTDLDLPLCPRDEVVHIIPPAADKRGPP